MTHGCELHHTLQHTRVFGLKQPRCRCSPLGVLSEAQRFLKSVFRVMKQNTRADGEWTWSLRRWLNSSPSCVDCATLESCCVFFTGTNLCLSVYLPQRAPENIHGHSRTSSHTGRHWEPALGCGVHTHTLDRKLRFDKLREVCGTRLPTDGWTTVRQASDNSRTTEGSVSGMRK